MDQITLVTVIGLAVGIGAGTLALGLVVGYWRGRHRGRHSAMAAGSEVDKLAGVGRAILSVQLKVDALCEVVYQESTRIVDTRNFQLGLFDDNAYHIYVWLRDGERLMPTHFPDAANAGLIGHVRRTASSLRVGDYQREWDALPAKPTYEGSDPPRSALFTPLLVAGEVIGVIVVQSDAAEAFTDESQRLMSIISSQAAGAIHNAQLYHKVQARANQLQLISEVGRQITAVQRLSSLFRQMVSLVQQKFDYHAVSVFTVDPETNIIKLGSSTSEVLTRLEPSLSAKDGLVGRVYATKATINVADVLSSAYALDQTALPSTRSELCIPLVVDDRVLGILDIQSEIPNTFRDDDVSAFESLAGQLGMAILESRAYEKAQRQAERINAMADASRAVVSILDINDLLDEVVDLIADYFGYDRVHLFLRSGNRLIFRSGSGVHSAKWAVERLSYDLSDRGFIPWAAQSGQPCISGDVLKDERYIVGPGLDDSRSEMTVPISMGQRVLGVFDIQSVEANAFSAEDVTLVQALADTVAVGLRNAGLFATETRRRMLSETLREISSTITSSLELESVLNEILTGLEKVVSYDAGMILLSNEQDDQSSVAAVRGMANEEDVLNEVVHHDQRFTSNLWALLYHMETEEMRAALDRHDQLYAPLEVEGEQIGTLAVDRFGEDKFGPEEVEIINTFAAQAAVAIANAQLFAAQQEEAWVTTALLQVAQSTNTISTIEQTLETLVRLTTILVGVTRCGVMLWDVTARHFIGAAAWGLEPEAAKSFQTLIAPCKDDPFFTALAEATDLIVAGGVGDHALPEKMRTLFGVPSLMFLPLLSKGTLGGAMIVEYFPGAANNIRRMNILTGIATQTALALENSRLQEEANERERLNKELELARDIQQSFLPSQLPEVEGYSLAAFYHSAQQIGGDFYDLIPIKGNQWGIVIADVAGKGVPAALYMALSRTNIRASAFSRDKPDETLIRVNELLLSDSRSNLFVTVWYGVWNPATGELNYSCTGHNPPLLVKADGSISELKAKGWPLNIIEEMKLESKQMFLEPGDVLIAYTDGVTDSQNMVQDFFGLDKLREVVIQEREHSARQIGQAILESVDQFIEGTAQFDDLTIVILKREPLKTELPLESGHVELQIFSEPDTLHEA